MKLRELLNVCCLDIIEGKLYIYIDKHELVYESKVFEPILLKEIEEWLDNEVEGFYPGFDSDLYVFIKSK
jgi:hypothetical protein